MGKKEEKKKKYLGLVGWASIPSFIVCMIGFIADSWG